MAKTALISLFRTCIVSLAGVLLPCAQSTATGFWVIHRAAESELGQPDLSSSGSGIYSSTRMPQTLAVAIDPTTGKVFVSDGGHRILRFSSSSSVMMGGAAEVILGQTTFNFSGSNGGNGAVAAANTFSTPYSMMVDNVGRLWVADRDNNRVLRFDNASSKGHKADADAVLGQGNFVANSPNRGAQVARNTLNAPSGVWSDGIALWVADSGNNRVVGYGLPALKANGADADIVFGQANFTASGFGATMSTMHGPVGLVVSGAVLYVVDSLNHRVLRFNGVDQQNTGASANGVLGQPGAPSRNTMQDPLGVAADSSGRLYIGDSGNHRVLIFDNAGQKENLANADTVLGQVNFDTGAPPAAAGPRAIARPIGLAYDNATDVLWVGDRDYSRALRFSLIVKVLDVDDNKGYDALTDSLLILRYLFGLTGDSLTGKDPMTLFPGNAIGNNAKRPAADAIVLYLDDIRNAMDVDGNRVTDALTDGLLILRYMFGLRGDSLTGKSPNTVLPGNAVGPGATRSTAAAIETYIQSLMP